MAVSSHRQVLFLGILSRHVQLVTLQLQRGVGATCLNANRWAGGIAEVNVSFASDTLQCFPIGSFGVDLWLNINKSNDTPRHSAIGKYQA